MGNCHKKIKVEPLVVKDSASEILSRGSQIAKPDGEQQADMVKDLKDQGDHCLIYMSRYMQLDTKTQISLGIHLV